MMRSARRASLLVAFSLLASAATAHAECAWVLWERTSSLTRLEAPAEWTILGAITKPEGCDRAISAAAHDRSSRGITNQQVDGSSVIWNLPGNTVQFSYLCLPDTVDPRGAKGK